MSYASQQSHWLTTKINVHIGFVESPEHTKTPEHTNNQLMFIKHMTPTDACAYRWPNQQCAIDHWGEDCRDVTTTKLQCENIQRAQQQVFYMKKKRWRKKKGGGGTSMMFMTIRNLIGMTMGCC